MLALKQAGVSNVAIASRLGVTEGAIRKALKRGGYQAPIPQQIEIERATPSVAEAVPGTATNEPTAVLAVTPTTASEPRDGPEPIRESPHSGDVSMVESSATPVEQETAIPVGTTAVVPVTTGQADVLTGTDPWDRSMDRAFARVGLITEAQPEFGDCQDVAGLGVLLALPALLETGMLDIATKVYSGWAAAFYGVRTVFLCLALMALQRIKHPEQLRHHSPPDLGRVLGLDRAPEVKTLREKVASLAMQGRSEKFMRELAQRRATQRPDAMGFLYVDGHVRVYSGSTKLGKMHVTRMRLSMPATADHWVNDRDGDPLLVITATPTAALAKEMLPIAKEVRLVVGDRRVTIVFDRGGWSPKLFAELIGMGFDILTYRKGRIPKVRRSWFKPHKGKFDGRTVTYQLAERRVRFQYPGGVVALREVVRLSDDEEHQTSIVTSRADLSAVEVAYRMFERWRQENFFKYMEAEFAIDALWAYGTEQADPKRDVPNPERKEQERELRAARAEVVRLERLMGAAAADNDESQRPSMRGFKIANSALNQQLRAAREKAAKLRRHLREIPKRVTAREAANGKPVVRLKTDAKRLTDTVKSVAYQAETALFRMVRPHYSREDDEGRKLIASAMNLSGDIHVGAGELRITLAPAASPSRTRAIAKLCEELTATNTVYPGTRLRLSYTIREA
ncbi:MAG: hypothetical protein HZA88_21985 [Verrucomicrobia bacterium]|nr:hypothetical protein [Verrucomicrobiota bacterium]